MKENLCDVPLISQITDFAWAVKRFGIPGGGGTGPSVVRLTVAYYCPDRTQVAEKELKANGYIT